MRVPQKPKNHQLISFSSQKDLFFELVFFVVQTSFFLVASTTRKKDQSFFLVRRSFFLVALPGPNVFFSNQKVSFSSQNVFFSSCVCFSGQNVFFSCCLWPRKVFFPSCPPGKPGALSGRAVCTRCTAFVDAVLSQDSLAEWSKAPDSSSGGAIRVGSNPTAVIFSTRLRLRPDQLEAASRPKR